MGLDITAYRKLTPAPDAELDSDGNPLSWEFYIVIRDTMEPHFPGRMRGIAPGVYEAAERVRFRAGSYGGYNQWRDWLARIAGHGSAKEVWALCDADPAKLAAPFAELIHFADNEGVIGPVVAAKLAQDFADYQRQAEECAEASDGFFVERYALWRKAFEMAADGGAVDFL